MAGPQKGSMVGYRTSNTLGVMAVVVALAVSVVAEQAGGGRQGAAGGPGQTPAGGQAPPPAGGQGRGGRGQAPAEPPPAPRAAAPIDLTGYWVSVVTEDWRWRMVTPPKGDYASIPINAEAKKVADAWDAAKDAAGDQCKAYGAPGLMRLPTRLHITWQDDTDAESGNRHRHADATPSFWRLEAAGRRPDAAGQHHG